MNNKDYYYDLEEKKNPTCSASIKLAQPTDKNDLLKIVAEFAVQNEMKEGPKAFYPDGRELAPTYFSETMQLSIFVMDLIPDKTQHYAQVRLDCVSKRFDFAKFSSIGNKFLRLLIEKFPNQTEFIHEPRFGDG